MTSALPRSPDPALQFNRLDGSTGDIAGLA
jgi:hypothetical protein